MDTEINETTGINLLSLVKLFWQHIKFISIFIAISMLIVLLISFVMPYKYKSTATLLPPEQGGSSGGISSFLQSMSGMISFGGGMGKDSKSRVFVEILKSREVAKYIVDSTDIGKLPQFADYDKETLYAIASSFIDVYVNPNGLIILETTVPTGWFSGKTEKKLSAEFSARAANYAIKGLDHINRTKSMSSAHNVRKYVESMLVEKREDLDSIENALEVFQNKYKVLSLPEQSSAILSEAVKIGSLLAESEVEMQILMQDLSADSPTIKSYKRKIAELKKQYENVQRGGLTGTEEFSIPMGSIPKLIRLYTGMMRDLKITEQIVIYLESQRFEEAVTEHRDISTVEVLDHAITPSGQESPKMKIMLLLSLVLSAIFAMVIVLAYTLYKGKIVLKAEKNADYYRNKI